MSYLTSKSSATSLSAEQITPIANSAKANQNYLFWCLVHLAATLGNWDPLLDLVADKHHVIVVDLLGVERQSGKWRQHSWNEAEQTIDFVKARLAR